MQRATQDTQWHVADDGALLGLTPGAGLRAEQEVNLLIVPTRSSRPYELDMKLTAKPQDRTV